MLFKNLNNIYNILLQRTILFELFYTRYLCVFFKGPLYTVTIIEFRTISKTVVS